jgi:putative membrane protein
MSGFVLRALVAALGLWVATLLVSGLSISGYGTLLLAALLLGVCNAVVKPVLILLTLPITVLTLGLFLLVINAAVLALVALLLPGFAIAGFWAAVLGSLVVSIISVIGSSLIK